MSNKSNLKMLYLSAFGIIFVVLGHTGGSSLLTVDQIFDYYAFHMPLFLFVTGYFYKGENDAKPFAFLLKKGKTLLIPFFAWNGIFLLVQTLMRRFGFTVGSTFSLYEVFIAPWVRLQPLTFAIPSWYLIALFISLTYYVIFRKLFSLVIRKDIVKEYVLLALFLVAGVASVYLRNRLQIGEAGSVYLRSVVMLFFIQLGLVYKRYWESRDTLLSAPYFAAVVALRFIIICYSVKEKYILGYGLYDFSNFEKTGLLFYLSGILGVALWLRIAALLAEHPRKSLLLMRIGNHTKEIMLFHLSGFFVLNCILYKIGPQLKLLWVDKATLFSSMYCSAVSGVIPLSLLYLLFGIGFSFLAALMIDWIKKGSLALFARAKKKTPAQRADPDASDENEKEEIGEPVAARKES